VDYYALKGEFVVCLRGHNIFEIYQHLPFPQLHSPSIMSKGEGNALPVESCTPRCPQCNEPYARWTNTANIELHFKDGWRDISGPNKRACSMPSAQRQFNNGSLDTKSMRRVG
jgi:hypothetical protein